MQDSGKNFLPSQDLSENLGCIFDFGCSWNIIISYNLFIFDMILDNIYLYSVNIFEKLYSLFGISLTLKVA